MKLAGDARQEQGGDGSFLYLLHTSYEILAKSETRSSSGIPEDKEPHVISGATESARPPGPGRVVDSGGPQPRPAMCPPRPGGAALASAPAPASARAPAGRRGRRAGLRGPGSRPTLGTPAPEDAAA